MKIAPNHIRVWAWKDAPEELKALSQHGGDEDWLALLPPKHAGKESNARRIVACVNACKGSPTEALEEMNRLGLTLGQLAFNHAEIMATVKDLPSGDEIRDVGVHLEAVTKQRDELLIALECLFARTFMTENSHTAQVFERARAAIISVKGGAA